jgi:hypothetical protein
MHNGERHLCTRRFVHPCTIREPRRSAKGVMTGVGGEIGPICVGSGNGVRLILSATSVVVCLECSATYSFEAVAIMISRHNSIGWFAVCHGSVPHRMHVTICALKARGAAAMGSKCKLSASKISTLGFKAISLIQNSDPTTGTGQGAPHSRTLNDSQPCATNGL